MSVIKRLISLSVILLCLSAVVSLAQELPSVAIRTDSQRDSLIFRIRLDGKMKLRIYFEDRLQGEIPPFKEKYFAIEPQMQWACVGMRETAEALEIIVFEDCENAEGIPLKVLYKAKDIPVGQFFTSL